jgi:2,4-dienoyl-CoA reductase-like NADH-dependent reductase (Old Yellow Enzyme family)/thioredoxin reductase
MKLLGRDRIGTLELKNRICFPPITTGFGAEDGCFGQIETDFAIERAKGGAALIFTDAVSVDRRHQLTFAPPLPYFDSDEQISKYARFVDLIHHNGAKCCIQIYHAGRQTTIAKRGGESPIGPSAVSSYMLGKIPYPDSVEMSEIDIEQAIQKFVLAAVRAKNAGFDAVDLDGGAGYLIQQFMSPFTNKRNDDWGGTFNKRMRFPIEIIKRTRELVGDNYPLIFDLCLDEYIEGGITPDQGVKMAEVLEDYGINAFRVHGVNMETYHRLIPTMESPTGINIPLGRMLKKSLTKAKVMLGQRINTPELAEQVLLDGVADFILLGRSLITDPYFPKKVIQNKSHLIRKCIACNHCVDELAYGRSIRCMLNPIVGFEREYSKLSVSDQQRKVLVIGGGPAGLEAAKIAAKRGHSVILCEKTDALGGQLKCASQAPHKSELGEIVIYYEKQFKELAVDVRMNCEIDVETVKNIAPDAVILATGADPHLPAIEGIKNNNVVFATDAIQNNDFSGKDSIVIIGGGSLGAEVAEMLLIQGYDATIIEMNDAIASDMGMSIAVNLHERLERYDFECVLGATVTRIDDKAVYYTRGNGEEGYVKANKVVLATGYASNNSLVENIQGLTDQIYVVGDCKTPRKIVNAVHEGFHASRMIE